MDSRFQDIFSKPENEIFRVVFFPDRIYHARYLNASVSDRYRYDVDEVRTKSGLTVMKGAVYLDTAGLTPFVRIEYRPARIIELVREKGRLLGDQLFLNIRMESAPGGPPSAEAVVAMTYCAKIEAYQVEIWQTTGLPPRRTHDIRVLNLMGSGGSITTEPKFEAFLDDIENIRRLHLSVREYDVDKPLGYAISDPVEDNNYERNIQVPNSPTPSDNNANTQNTGNYVLDFQRGFFIQADTVEPVRYRNAMMNDDDPEQDNDNNIVAMRWLLQQELGGNLVFFHEVTVPPGVVEGTHRHIGSEELYYVVRGKGIAYMGHKDDPATENLPVVQRSIFGLDPYDCREIPVRPGSVIFTKSGGIHGIRNNGSEDLVFVAFLYHGS